MIDAHCHLYELDESAWVNNGLEAMVCAGAGLETSRKAVELAQVNPKVYATVGVHPEESEDRDENELRKLLKMPKVVAVGECGLDLGGETEEELLKFNVGLAQETGLPLVIHNRHQDAGILRLVGYDSVMLHCFTSDTEFMKVATGRGWYISFGGILTFKSSQALRETAKLVPGELLLVETDSPYLAPEPIRGTVNRPGNVKIVIEKLAEVRGCTFEEAEKITSENAKKLFKL